MDSPISVVNKMFCDQQRSSENKPKSSVPELNDHKVHLLKISVQHIASWVQPSYYKCQNNTLIMSCLFLFFLGLFVYCNHHNSEKTQDHRPNLHFAYCIIVDKVA